jgi:light-regulated signal transduction histidine kinase (bacteriophytochrome)
MASNQDRIEDKIPLESEGGNPGEVAPPWPQRAEALEARVIALEEHNARLEERNARLEEANREFESLSYAIAHDLRMPLRAVDGFSRVLLDKHGAVLPPDGRQLLNVVRENAQRMDHLLEALLRFSRLSRHSLQKRDIDNNALVCEVLQELQASTPGRTVQVDVGALPICQGDPILLRQVWSNLLQNAWKYTQGREAAHIEIGGSRFAECAAGVSPFNSTVPAVYVAGQGGEDSTSTAVPQAARDRLKDNADADAALFWVRDNGAGFDMRYASRLFEVFQRLHRDEEFAGDGVGLAIVFNIVRRHGGCVWAHGEVGQGASFFFCL